MQVSSWGGGQERLEVTTSDLGHNRFCLKLGKIHRKSEDIAYALLSMQTREFRMVLGANVEGGFKIKWLVLRRDVQVLVHLGVVVVVVIVVVVVVVVVVILLLLLSCSL